MIYPHSITLIKSTELESSLGGTNRIFPGGGPSYRAFVQPQRESLSTVNEIGGVDMVVTIYAEPSAPIEATDRISFENRLYEVTGSINQYSQLGSHHLKVVARLLDFQP